MAFKSVLFPLPDAPITAAGSPGRKVRVMSCNKVFTTAPSAEVTVIFLSSSTSANMRKWHLPDNRKPDG